MRLAAGFRPDLLGELEHSPGTPTSKGGGKEGEKGRKGIGNWKGGRGGEGREERERTTCIPHYF